MMTEVFGKLRSLQEILSRKFETEAQIAEIPKALATKTELLNRLKKTYLDKSTTLKATEQKIKELRQRMLDAEMEREKRERLMDKIQTQREYEALDKEIQEATEKEQELRRELQREDQFFEEMKMSLEKEEIMIKKQEEEVQSEQSRIKHEIKERSGELTELEEQEKEITPGLDEDILFKFERIIRSKAGLGIVPVQKGVCTGCHMILPAQYVNEVRQGEGIMFCPYCSRILFFPDSEAGEDETLEAVATEEVEEEAELPDREEDTSDEDDEEEEEEDEPEDEE